MKHWTQILCLLALALMPGRLYAQDDGDDYDTYVNFMYLVSPDESYIRRLNQKLRSTYDDDYEFGWYDIFYMSNDEEPLVAKSDDEDYSEKFGEILSGINRGKTFYAYPEYDMKYFLTWLQGSQYVDTNGKLKKGVKININLYVNSTFWEDGGNRDFVSALYYTLDCPRHPEFDITVFRCDDSPLWEAKGTELFGDFASEKLNDYLHIVDF